MEIQCPSCLKRLAIGDQYAGQLVKCPACNGVFMAPTLAKPPAPAAAPVAPLPPVAPTPPPAPSSAPAPAHQYATIPEMPALSPSAAPAPLPTGTQVEILSFAGDPVQRPEMPAYPPPSSSPSTSFKPTSNLKPEPEPVGPPGEFTKTRTVPLRPDVVRWIAPVCLALIFLLSFAPWIAANFAVHLPQQGEQLKLSTNRNLWEVAFGEPALLSYILYLLLTLFVALPLAWVKLLMEINVVPMPDVVRPFWPWRSVAIFGVLAVTLFFPMIDWLHYNLMSANLTGLGMNLGIRLHVIALVASGIDFWLSQRSKKRLPTPEATFRW